MDNECRNRFLSQEYGEVIYNTLLPEYLEDLEGDYCRVRLLYNMEVVSLPLDRVSQISINENYAYRNIPKLFGLMDTTALEESGIIRIQNQPVLDLKGQGVIVAFLDTGIDYTHPAFRFSNGKSRILSIWDMTVQEGTPPEGMPFGTEYTNEEIQEALDSDNPYDIVPSGDENGHGTFMAGVAAGSQNDQEDFIGAAPLAQIVMVKVRQAKQYLRDFYQVAQGAIAYSEADLLLAMQYLKMVWVREQKPMVICFGMGTNTGDHAGNTQLGIYMNIFASSPGIAIVMGTGNEGDKRHHFRGIGVDSGAYEDVEIRVDQGESGFYMELWARVPEIYSVGILSPTGENIGRIPVTSGSEIEINFLFENTTIYLSYVLAEENSGNEVIAFRFIAPTPGIWTVRVYGNNIIGNGYHMWLPITEFLSGETYFIRPDPDVTLTVPSSTVLPISVSNYNHKTGGFFMESGRGYPLNGYIKPDFAAPGVNVWGTLPGGRYGARSGSSVSAAITAGACAQFLTWGIVKGNSPRMNTQEIKNYFIQGAGRERDELYPKRTFGYGKLDIYNAFESIRNR